MRSLTFTKHLLCESRKNSLNSNKQCNLAVERSLCKTSNLHIQSLHRANNTNLPVDTNIRQFSAQHQAYFSSSPRNLFLSSSVSALLHLFTSTCNTTAQLRQHGRHWGDSNCLQLQGTPGTCLATPAQTPTAPLPQINRHHQKGLSDNENKQCMFGITSWVQAHALCNT